MLDNFWRLEQLFAVVATLRNFYICKFPRNTWATYRFREHINHGKVDDFITNFNLCKFLMLAYAGYHHFKHITFRSPKEAFITCFETQSAYKKTQEYVKGNLKRKFRFDCREKKWLISQVKISVVESHNREFGLPVVRLKNIICEQLYCEGRKKSF